MRQKPNCEFSDSQIEEIDMVVRDEFVPDSGWMVVDVHRRTGCANIVDVTIEHLVGERKKLTIEVPCQRPQAQQGWNSSPLTDAVFSFSIRLMEFAGTRGFDEFQDGETVSLAQ